MNEEINPLHWAVDGPPIGLWTTSNGTFDNVMIVYYAFFRDGSGFIKTGNALGLDRKLFRWTFEKTGQLTIHEAGQEEDLEKDLEEDLDGSYGISYCASWQDLQGEFAVPRPVLVSCNRDESGCISEKSNAFGRYAHAAGLGGLTFLKAGPEFETAFAFNEQQKVREQKNIAEANRDKRKMKVRRFFYQWFIPLIGGLTLAWIGIKLS